MSAYKSPIPVHPGETLYDILEATGMSQVELSKRTGLHTKTINEIVKGKKPISPNTALKLSIVFGTSEKLWNNLQKDYDETVARLEYEKEIEKGEAIVSKYTVYSNLIKYGLVNKATTKKDKAYNLLHFFGVSSFDALDNIYLIENTVFRKTNKSPISIENLKAWLRFGELEAAKIETKSFNLEKLKAVLPEIRKLNLLQPEKYSLKLIKLLSECGIALVFLPYFKNTAVNGATRWINPSKVSVLVTPKNKMEDILWFTLFHELGHVLKHSKKLNYISFWNENNLNDLYSLMEKEADKFAADTLIPTKYWQGFFRKRNFTKNEIIDFGQTVGVKPGIVAGRLARETNNWSKFSYLRTKINIG